MAYFWTDAEISFVATNYNIMTVRSICEKINRPQSSVRMLASKLGVTDQHGATQRRLVQEEARPPTYDPFITGKIGHSPSLSSWNRAYG